jgi:serine/threonine protein phosphatase PrpC
VLTLGCQLVTANVGNSRAIVFDRNRKVRVLTPEQGPAVRGEKSRIEKAGATVISEAGTSFVRYETEGGKPERLDLSRSLGDYQAHKVGVISTPDVTFTSLGEDDCIVVLATQGIWRMMSDRNVASLASAHYEAGAAEAAANALVRRATTLWKEKHNYVEDITCVVIFLERGLIRKNFYTKAEIYKIEEAERLEEFEREKFK